MDHSPHSTADSDQLLALIVDDEAPARERRRFLEEPGDSLSSALRCARSALETDP